MAEREIIKKYSSGELTVVWKPKRCVHAAICVKTLPQVYDPNDRPWIKADKASTKALIAQISKCPSGALSYELDGDQVQGEADEPSTTKVQVLSNGPLLVQGRLSVSLANGEVEDRTDTTAFCRCGASGNKPYCDGSHKTSNFEA